MKNIVFKNIIIGGDIQGVNLLMKCIPQKCIGGIIAASNTPETINYFDYITHTKNMKLILHLPKNNKNFYTYFEEFEKQNFDLLILNNYPQYVEKEFLELLNYKAINIHNSLLPKYKSQTPIQYAIMNNETEIGVTFYMMSNKLFEGNIIYQDKTSIEEEDTYFSVNKKIIQIKETILRKSINDILTDNFDTTPQMQNQYKVMHKIKETDLEINLLTMTQTQIYNIIRANADITPSPFILHNGEKIEFKEKLDMQEVKNIIKKYKS